MPIRHFIKLAIILLSPLAAQAADYTKVEKLLDTQTTNIGQQIHYPAGGPAKVTSLIVTLMPGEKTGRHKHPVPLYAYMLSGELSIDYGEDRVRTYKAGDAFIEAQDTWHDGTNPGTEPTRILAVFVGMVGVDNVVRP